MIKIKATVVADEITEAVSNGFTTISEQGSSRSGKTYNTLLWLIGFVVNNPLFVYKVSVVRATLPALKGSVLEDFKEILKRMNRWKEQSFNKTDLIYTFDNGSTFEFFSSDNEQK